MLTLAMLRRALKGVPKHCECYIVGMGQAWKITALAHSDLTQPGMVRLWFIAGGEADHIPPTEIYLPRYWLNQPRNGRVAR